VSFFRAFFPFFVARNTASPFLFPKPLSFGFPWPPFGPSWEYLHASAYLQNPLPRDQLWHGSLSLAPLSPPSRFAPFIPLKRSPFPFALTLRSPFISGFLYSILPYLRNAVPDAIWSCGTRRVSSHVPNFPATIALSLVRSRLITPG
jgi:hypothetical protein